MSWGDLSFCVPRGRVREVNFFSKLLRHCDRQIFGERVVFRTVAPAITAVLFFILATVQIAAAQTPSVGVLAPGNAVVTGFSGAPLPAQIAPGANPGDQTFIDLNGPSARVFDLQAPGAPPQAQVIAAPALFTVIAAQVGQVFGVALDNASPPNIYVAATSVYGLPIVVPGPDGTPKRVHQGTLGASFMAGLFGPAAQGGGPGSIWRIDGATGAVSLFANVALNSIANSGPALGGLTFDSASNTLLVSDRQTGMIHRFDLGGKEVGRYDHGVQGRQAAGLPPVPFNSSYVAINSPQFSSDDPASWGYAPLARLIFGLAVHSGRLYYAVAQGLEVWSVSLLPDGSFGSDARREVQVPEAEGDTEISKIAFENNGDMLLAERAPPTGDYTFEAVAQPGISSVLRYVPGNGPSLWQPAPQQYAIGFPQTLTNGNGGVAVGYGYDARGAIDRSSCGGFLWSTGEQLRNPSDPNLAARLSANGPLDVNGLQGNGIDLVAPANVPPTQSYFVDYAAQLDDPAVRGHLGDIAIPMTCGQAALQGARGAAAAFPPMFPLALPGLPFPLPPPPPPGSCPGGMPPGPSGCACIPHGMPPGPPSTVCCPAGDVVGSGGQCQSPCPGGQSTPNEQLCLLGIQPTPGSNGDFDCLNGTDTGVSSSTPPSPQQLQQVFAACASQSPWATQANCPTSWTLQPVQGLSGVQLCQPPPNCTASSAGLQLGPNGQCQQLCPNGGLQLPLNGPPSQQIPICPQPPCQGPNCVPPPCTGPNCVPPPCTGPNCPTPPCTGPNCTPPPCTGTNCPPSQCQPGTSPQPGFTCCQRGFFPTSGGGCQSSCPNGASDPKSLGLCMRGFNPVPNGAGQYTCLNGAPASAQPGQPGANTACIAQAPFANQANCPQGYSYQADPNLGGAMVCLRTPAENACRQQGMDVGLNGTCQQVCPPGSGEFPFPTTQCCPNGATLQPNGSCAPPPQNNNCQPGSTQYCAPITGTLCKLGQEVPGGCCPEGSTPAAGGACVQTGSSCGSGSQTICCQPGQVPQPNGQCGPPPTTPLTPPGSCGSGTTTYCQPLTGGRCPTGSSYSDGSCIAAGGACGANVQSLCCPSNATANFSTSPPSCTPNPTQPNNPTTPPPSSCQSSGGSLYCGTAQSGACPSGTVVYNGGTCLATGPSCPTNIQLCCPGNQLPNFNTGSCCPPNTIPQGGSCITPPPPSMPTQGLPTNNCQPQNGQTLFCAPLPSGACPPGSNQAGANCVATGGSCGAGSQSVCCPNFSTPNPSTGQCCPPNQTFQNGACVCPGTIDARGLCCMSSITPNGLCTTGIGLPAPLFCPPGTVKVQGGGCVPVLRVPMVPTTPGVLVPVAPTQPGCAAGYVLSGTACVRASTLCPRGGVPGPNGCGPATSIGVTPGTSTSPPPCPNGGMRTWRGCEPSSFGVTTTPTIPREPCKFGERGCERGNGKEGSKNSKTTIEHPRRDEEKFQRNETPPRMIERPLRPLTFKPTGFGRR